MLALLEINGWRKVQEIPEDSIRNGSVEVPLEPSMAILVPAFGEVPSKGPRGVIITLFYRGTMVGNKPFFADTFS